MVDKSFKKEKKVFALISIAALVVMVGIFGAYIKDTEGSHGSNIYPYTICNGNPANNCIPDTSTPLEDIAQNTPWCHDAAWTCELICQEFHGVSGGVCDDYAAQWDFHPILDKGYFYPGTCELGTGLCRYPRNPPIYCSSPTVLVGPYCGTVPGPGPTTTCSPGSQSVSVGQLVSFTGSASGGETPYNYSWTAPGAIPSSGSGTNFNNIIYSSSGVKTVTLTVTDDDGNTDSDQCTVNVGVPGGGSVTISPLDAKAQPAGVSPYQDSLIYSSTPLTVDVSETVSILSGCTVGSTCDISYRVDCTNDGTFDGISKGYSNQTNSPPVYTQFFASHCTYTTPGSYTLRGRVEVWPQSDPSDITSAEDLVPITITSAPPAAPTVTLNASPTSVPVGGSTTLTWSTTNATSCAASSGWVGSKGTSGSEIITGIVANTIFRLDCGGPGGTAFDTASVTISGPNPDVSVAITAVNGSSPDLRDVKNGDRLTFEIEYRNAGSGTATNVQNVEINLSGNHQYISGSLNCPASGGGSCSSVTTSNQQITFNRNSALPAGNAFTVRFDSIVSTGQNQPLEILTVNTSGIFNPGAIGFDETYALIAGANREPSPGFREVAP